MKIETSLNYGQEIFMVMYNSIHKYIVDGITITEKKRGQNTIPSVHIGYSLDGLENQNNNIDEEDVKEGKIFLTKEECRKALILKVMEM